MLFTILLFLTTFAVAFLASGEAAFFTNLILLEAVDPQWFDTPGFAADMALVVARWTVLATVAFAISYCASGGLQRSQVRASSAAVVGATCAVVAAFVAPIAPLGLVPLFPTLGGFLLARWQPGRPITDYPGA